MDRNWYERPSHRRGDGYVTEDEGMEDYAPHAASSCAAAAGSSDAAAAAIVAPSLPSVRATWQGLLPSSNICVDSFTASNLSRFQAANPGMAACSDLIFCLTHMHADHTGGLTPSWNLGTIYTSATSKLLLHAKFGLPDSLVVALPLHRPTLLSLNRTGSERMWITLIDASTHCPGAVMLLLEGYWGRVLYSGDLRFDRVCEENLLRFAQQYESLKAEQIRIMAQKGKQQGTTALGATDGTAHALGLPARGLQWLLEEPAAKQRAEVVGARGGRAPVQELGGSEDSVSVENTPPALEPCASSSAVAVGTCASSEAPVFDERITAPPARGPHISDGAGVLGVVDALYLDNTFCHPHYAVFHSTASIVRAVRRVILAHPACDVLLGGDTLGKEDMLVLLAHACKSRIVVPDARWKLLKAMADKGVQLNTDVTDEEMQELLRLGDEPADAAGAAASCAAFSAAAASSSAPLPSPLLSPSDWLSCFSPNPLHGRIKLGPKTQVTRRNVEWMNDMVARSERSRRTRRKNQMQETGRKRKRMQVDDEDEQNAAVVGECSEPEEEADAMQDADAPSASSDDDAESASAAEDADGGLDRPVIGIIVSGWAVDRQTKSGISASPAYVTSSDADAALALPPELDADVAAKCDGPGPGSCLIHTLPYSSHSSYAQLRRFVSLVRPAAIRPLCKGDTNPAVMHDLLNHAVPARAIVIPETMTRAPEQQLRPVPAVLDEAQRQRKQQALSQAVANTSSSFTALASSLQSSVRSRGAAAGTRAVASATSHAAISIGGIAALDGDEKPHRQADTASAHGALIELDQSLEVDLTGDSLPSSSLPELEDASGCVVKSSTKAEPSTVRVVDSAPLAAGISASAVSAKAEPLPASSDLATSAAAPALPPRLRSWLDVFELFEHYPHVPIPGLVVPAPSEEHVLSYGYARRERQRNDMERAAKSIAQRQQKQLQRSGERGTYGGAAQQKARKLPGFLQPPMPQLLISSAPADRAEFEHRCEVEAALAALEAASAAADSSGRDRRAPPSVSSAAPAAEIVAGAAPAPCVRRSSDEPRRVVKVQKTLAPSAAVKLSPRCTQTKAASVSVLPARPLQSIASLQQQPPPPKRRRAIAAVSSAATAAADTARTVVDLTRNGSSIQSRSGSATMSSISQLQRQPNKSPAAAASASAAPQPSRSRSVFRLDCSATIDLLASASP